jgi:hypothetical protein
MAAAPPGESLIPNCKVWGQPAGSAGSVDTATVVLVVVAAIEVIVVVGTVGIVPCAESGRFACPQPTMTRTPTAIMATIRVVYKPRDPFRRHGAHIAATPDRARRAKRSQAAR